MKPHYFCPYCKSKRERTWITCGDPVCKVKNRRDKQNKKKPVKIVLPWDGINSYLEQCRKAEKRQHATNPFA
jgi:hypothetical protein